MCYERLRKKLPVLFKFITGTYTCVFNCAAYWICFFERENDCVRIWNNSVAIKCPGERIEGFLYNPTRIYILSLPPIYANIFLYLFKFEILIYRYHVHNFISISTYSTLVELLNSWYSVNVTLCTLNWSKVNLLLSTLDLKIYSIKKIFNVGPTRELYFFIFFYSQKRDLNGDLWDGFKNRILCFKRKTKTGHVRTTLYMKIKADTANERVTVLGGKLDVL